MVSINPPIRGSIVIGRQNIVVGFILLCINPPIRGSIDVKAIAVAENKVSIPL